MFGKSFIGQGVEIGVALSYSGFSKGENDLGGYFQVAGGGGQVDIGTPMVGATVGLKSGDVEGLNGRGAQFTFNDGVGGLSVSTADDVNSTINGVGLQLGPGILLQSAGTITYAGGIAKIIRELLESSNTKK